MPVSLSLDQMQQRIAAPPGALSLDQMQERVASPGALSVEGMQARVAKKPGMGQVLLDTLIKPQVEFATKAAATATHLLTETIPDIARNLVEPFVVVNEAMKNGIPPDDPQVREAILDVALGITPLGAASRMRRLGRAIPRAKGAADETAIPDAAPSPAASATSTAFPPKPEFAGNINLSKLQTSDDVKASLVDVAQANDDFMPARRGVVSQAETQRLADEMGMTVDDLLKRREGQAFNAHEALAARQLLIQSREEWIAAGRVADASGGDEAEIAFLAAQARHAAIQEQVAGMTAEAGRALNIFGKLAASPLGRRDEIAAIIQQAGGSDQVRKMAAMVADLDDPAAAAFARQAFKPKMSDYILELWINGLLSGPRTHITNILSNTMATLWQLPEFAVAAGLGAARGGADKVFFSELFPRAFGLVEGGKDGLRLAGRAFRTETPSDMVTKIETRVHRAIPGVVGGVVRTPGRALLAEDEFFKAINYRSDINGQAVAVARGEGLTGRALAARVAELRDEPTAEMIEAAVKHARTMTFTAPAGDIAGGVMRIRAAHPMMNFIIPFVRTPAKIVEFAAMRSPFGLLMRKVKDDIARGGRARDLAVARMGVGTSIGAAVASLAAEGHITGGGPSDPRARAAMVADGWQPYSIKIGDKYYSYQRLEPMAMLFGIAADMADIAAQVETGDLDPVAGMVAASIAKNLTSKVWLSGPVDAMEAMTDPDRYAQQFINRLAASAIPTGVAHVAQEQDPIMRDARTLLDSIMARVPGYSADLPAQRDVWGEPIVRKGAWGPDLLSPIFTSERKNDPVNNELLRLGNFPLKPDRKIGGIELTPVQYAEYVEIAGKPAKRMLDLIVGAAGSDQAARWAALPDVAKRKVVDDIMRTTREAARGQMQIKYPDLLVQKIMEKVP